MSRYSDVSPNSTDIIIHITYPPHNLSADLYHRWPVI